MNRFLVSLAAVAILFVASVSLAAPINYQGLYQFKNSFEVATSKAQILLRVGNAEERQVLAGFRKEGFACKAEPNSHFSCSKIMPLKLTEANAASLLKRFDGYTVDFRATEGSFAQVNDSEFLKEWEREQKVLIAGQPFYKVRHIEGQNFAKLKIYSNDTKEVEWFNVVRKDSAVEIRHPLFLNQKRSSKYKNVINITETFLIELILE